MIFNAAYAFLIAQFNHTKQVVMVSFVVINGCGVASLQDIATSIRRSAEFLVYLCDTMLVDLTVRRQGRPSLALGHRLGKR